MSEFIIGRDDNLSFEGNSADDVLDSLLARTLRSVSQVKFRPWLFPPKAPKINQFKTLFLF
ncbi:MAG: hypothetical protein QGM50_01890, partial [Anaerolineae bacterium]|nr:hypothetical protein [Anaerolineae bacterium]